jgi:hypothetical protein
VDNLFFSFEWSGWPGREVSLTCPLAGHWCLWVCWFPRRQRTSAEGYTVRGYVHVPQSSAAEPLRPVLTPAWIVCAVRNHNVARVNKSHQSFGDRFPIVVIDDLITSDLLAAVKGM